MNIESSPVCEMLCIINEVQCFRLVELVCFLQGLPYRQIVNYSPTSKRYEYLNLYSDDTAAAAAAAAADDDDDE